MSKRDQKGQDLKGSQRNVVDWKEASRLFRIKKNQIKLVSDRGFDIPKEEKEITTTTLSGFVIQGIENAKKEDVDFRDTLTKVYRKDRKDRKDDKDRKDTKEKKDTKDTKGSKEKAEILLVYYARPPQETKNLPSSVVDIFLNMVNDESATQAIMITRVMPSGDSIQKIAKMPSSIQIFFDSELTYNPIEHYLVPRHELLDESEQRIFLSKFKLADLDIIRKNDAIIKYYGWQQGGIVRIYRKVLFLEKLVKTSISYRVIING